MSFYESETDNINENTFESRLEAPFKAVVSYRDTGYEKVIDFANKKFLEKKYIFDAEGNQIVYYVIRFNSFYKFEPKDVDKDGVYEIVFRQYAFLGSHVLRVVFTELVLSFDDGYDSVSSTKFTE